MIKKLWLGVLFPLLLLSQHNRTTCLIDAPTAYTLPERTIRFSLMVTAPNAPIPIPYPKTLEPRYSKTDADFSISYGLLENLEISGSMYTLGNYALGLSYQVVEETDIQPAIALGIHEINWLRHISSVGGGYDANGDPIGWDWDVEFYPQTGLLPTENFSIFGVISKEFLFEEAARTDTVETPTAIYYYTYASVIPLFRIHIGLGRGRYVGYGPHSSWFNTDVFFGTYRESPKHEWAVGLFGGLELFPGTSFSPAVEYDGRDFNVGASVLFLFEQYLIRLNASMDKWEAYFWGDGKYFHRLALGLEVEIPTETRSTLKGTVYDEQTNEPVEGVAIRLPGTPVPSTITDDRGRYLIKGVPPGKVIVRIEKRDYLSREYEIPIEPRKTMVTRLPIRKTG